jgi:hypothetical protein
MRQGLTFVLLLLDCATPAWAQQRDTSSVYSVPDAGAGSPVSGMLRMQRSFLFIDVAHNAWADRPEEIENYFFSGGFNFNLFYEVSLIGKVLKLAPGISFSNATVKHNSYIFTSRDTANNLITVFTPIPDSVDYCKSKISASYIDVPLEFRLAIRPDARGRNFWIAPGLRAGVRVSDFWKYKGEITHGTETKLKVYNLHGIEDFRYGISLRAGYYKFGLFAFYSLSDLFEEEAGPLLAPFSVGVCFTPL